MCALIYQIAWLREFRLIFGASTAASAAVLAIFMGGLGAGGLLLGPRVDRSDRPLLYYARLELAIALFTIITPFLLYLVRLTYIGLGGAMALGAPLAAGLRLLLAALVLAIPTLLMGGTLPAAARAVMSDRDAGRRGVGLLYGVNTLGAVTGCMLATFYLLEAIGTRQTLWLACLCNLVVAGMAWRLASKPILALPLPAEAAPEAPPAAPASAPAERATRGLVLIGATTVGFAFFLMEMVWYRMLGPLLGGTVYTFGLILAVALLGIALGGACYSALFARRRPTLAGFAASCLLEAVAMLIPFALGDSIAILAQQLRPLAAFGFIGHVAAWSAVAMIVMLPAAFIAGLQFPMLIALLGRGRERVGRDVGLTYAWNTVGAIAGSLAGGFGLLPVLSATGCWRGVALVLLGLGLVAVVISARLERRWRSLLVPSALAIVVVLLAGSNGPTAAWRHSGIGAGRADFSTSPNVVKRWLHAERRNIVWAVDGVESSVALVARDGYAFIVNGKSDGNARSDAPTMVMSGILPALLHPDPRRAMVIGLGTGATAGWLGALPSIEQVDVVELERAVLDVARACAPVNEAVMSNPKVVTTIADGREVLLTSDRRYDLIVSEPSNPYRAGVASLFTVEFYRAIARRLEEGGLFLQWVQAYEVDSKTLRTVIATVARVFPYVEAWQLHAGDLALIASMQPIAYDAPRLRARIASAPFRRALLSSWRATSLEDVLGRFVAGAKLTRVIARAEGERLNRDDHNRVEFDFARTVGRAGLFLIPAIRATGRRYEAHRPAVEGLVDWSRVADAEVDATFIAGVKPSRGSYLTSDQRQRLSADQRARAEAKWHFANARPRQALAAWHRQARQPQGAVELVVVAGSLAALGDARAPAAIAELADYQPVEAEVLSATYYYRTDDISRATAHLEAALAAYRTDPWPLKLVMSGALALARRISKRDQALAARLHTALAEPFSVYVLDARRQQALADISMMLADTSLCVAAMNAFEPYPRWTEAALLARAECYEINRDPRADAAWRDLDRFIAKAPSNFGAGLR